MGLMMLLRLMMTWLPPAVRAGVGGLVLLAAWPMGSLWAQQDGSPPTAAASTTASLTVATMEEKRQVWADSALEAAVKEPVLALAAEAVAQLRQRDQAETEAKTFRARAAALPEEARKLKEEIEKSATAEPPPPPEGDPKLDALEVALAASHEAVEKARQALAAAQELPRVEAARRQQLTAITTDLTARLATLRQTAPAAGNDAAELTEARALARDATTLAAQARLDAAQAELASFDAALSVAWPSVSQEAAAARLRRAQAEEAAWQERVKQARLVAADASVQAARDNVTNASEETRPELDRLNIHADENRDLVRNLIPAGEARLKEVEEEGDRWADLAVRTREKIRRLGASGVIGVELRRQLQQLPSPSALRLREGALRDELLEVERSRLELEDELSSLPAVASAESKAQEALRDILNERLKNYGVYFNLLVRVDEATQELTAAVTAQRRYIREQILWMPSAAPVGLASWGKVAASLAWLAKELAGGLGPELWWGLLRGSLGWPGLALLALAGLLFFLQHQARRRLLVAADEAGEFNTGFAPTARALLWTFLLAAPWPFLLWALARSLPASASTFMTACGLGLERAALVLFGLEIFRQVLRPRGLAEAHFGWPADTLKPLRRQLWRVMLVVGPAVVLGATLRHAEEIRHDSLERLCLLVMLLAVTWWLHLLWKRGRAGLREPELAGEKHLPAARFGWWLGHALCVTVPLLLAVLALRGYLHTAQELSVRLATSLAALAGFLLLRELFFRWYALHRQSLRSARARELREAREASRAAAAKVEAASETTPSDPAAAPVKAASSDLAPEIPPQGLRGPDIDVIGQEMRQLVEIVMVVLMSVALWLIWADVMAAAQKIGQQPLGELFSFDASGAAPTAATPASPTEAATPAAAPSPGLNLAGLLLAGLVASFTWMAARRIPGALQFLLSSQVPLDSGLRFAVGSVTRYLIVVTGMVIVLRLLGVAWSHVQWLAAALTVGLGFGLQEIFANFFSGLILLFERPIRPGDVVTIDSITGTVTRIHIRATTIRTADYTEYIVPNREFITGKLLNWTLSDTTNRMTLEVRVAYGTDLPRALDILRRLTTAHPLIRKDPAPVVSCEGLQDSAIKLVARYFLSSLDQRLATQTDLLCQVVKEFTAAGIEIPFPQQDLHVRSLPQGLTTSQEGLTRPAPSRG